MKSYRNTYDVYIDENFEILPKFLIFMVILILSKSHFFAQPNLFLFKFN